MSDLIDRHEFIENERKLYCEDCDRRKGTKNGKPNVICYEIGEAPCRACWLDDALGDLEDFPAASPWHRVEEPPKEYGNYLAVVNGEVMEVTYSDRRDDWNWSTCDAEGFVWIRSEFVTHWMPMPEPPKEDA